MTLCTTKVIDIIIPYIKTSQILLCTSIRSVPYWYINLWMKSPTHIKQKLITAHNNLIRCCWKSHIKHDDTHKYNGFLMLLLFPFHQKWNSKLSREIITKVKALQKKVFFYFFEKNFLYNTLYLSILVFA